jgi:hypothetical protein
MSLQHVRKSLLKYSLYKSIAVWYYNHLYAIPYKLRFLKANKNKSILFYPQKPFAMFRTMKSGPTGPRLDNQNVTQVV